MELTYACLCFAQLLTELGVLGIQLLVLALERNEHLAGFFEERAAALLGLVELLLQRIPEELELLFNLANPPRTPMCLRMSCSCFCTIVSSFSYSSGSCTRICSRSRMLSSSCRAASLSCSGECAATSEVSCSCISRLTCRIFSYSGSSRPFGFESYIFNIKGQSSRSDCFASSSSCCA